MYDLLVVGGGINGAGIARDAAGRGLKVLLCEQHDLASHTSSHSTKLIHGGLRYLEQYEFSLVRKALIEREVLLRAAPHLIRPMRFVLPHNKDLRPYWMIRMGLFLYDHLGANKLLPGSSSVELRSHPAGRPLREDMTKGFVYSDCTVQDSRLVVVNALDAVERGAEVLTRTMCAAAERGNTSWRVTLRSTDTGTEREVDTRCIANVAGPWVKHFLEDVAHVSRPHDVRLVTGSHIIVPKMFEHEYAYIFQTADRRIVFAIPYEQNFTLIGTTDVEFDGDPADITISDSERSYLCDAINRYFTQRISPKDIVSTYSGVRPLFDDGTSDASTVTRGSKLDLDAPMGRAPLISVFGGKVTTYRTLAEEVLATLSKVLSIGNAPWTAGAPLPGGDMADANFDAFAQSLIQSRSWMPPELALRYARAYGTRVENVLGSASKLADLGMEIGEGVYEAEVDYLCRCEWARTADDILWRRSRLGLHVAADSQNRLQEWLSKR